jgi:hypothetical protein
MDDGIFRHRFKICQTRSGELYAKDTVNEEVLGSFYQPELSRVKITDDMVYRVDKVLRKRKNQVLVS